MGCSFSKELLEKVIHFHGHNCPGLTIGIRAAEYALQEFSHEDSDGLVCITETDMCAVDGIQYLTKCTFGKGNLLHRDYGKVAFSFYHPQRARGVRFLYTRGRRNGGDALPKGKEDAITALLEEDLEHLFTREELPTGPPRSARILESLECHCCGEDVMESRTRRYGGEIYCIPCFRQVDQKR